ncbi:hypothetical protein VTO42DRAFT_7392 [Malbranchea cinnamomea]
MMASPSPGDLVSRMEAFMRNYMQAHDPSHNPAHVHRVVALAHRILARERSLHPEIPYDQTVITLSALLHDINDRKYASSSNGTSASAAGSPGSSPVRTALLAHGASPELADRVDTITAHVSYSTERKVPEVVARLIQQDGYPELAIVQDADRLDALGAVGVGRCFTYLGASAVRKTTKKKDECHGEDARNEHEDMPTLDDAIAHFGEKLEKLEGVMKTQTGREMARVRTERLCLFRSWWEEEMNESAGMIWSVRQT